VKLPDVAEYSSGGETDTLHNVTWSRTIHAFLYNGIPFSLMALAGCTSVSGRQTDRWKTPQRQ